MMALFAAEVTLKIRNGENAVDDPKSL